MQVLGGVRPLPPGLGFVQKFKILSPETDARGGLMTRALVGFFQRPASSIMNHEGETFGGGDENRRQEAPKKIRPSASRDFGEQLDLPWN